MLYNFLKLKKRNGVMGLNQRNIELIYPHNQRKNYQYADDKVKAKHILHSNDIATAKTYAVIERISDVKKKWLSCKDYESMAVKPANGSGGGGILILRKDEKGQWKNGGKAISESKILHHITSIVSGFYSMNSQDSCLIEECIVPHPFFAEIYGDGVPDFRIITLKAQPIIGMLRMPTSKSNGKANLHQKGVGIGVDLYKGVLTQTYDGKNYLDCHPDNPEPINGKPIPYWKELYQLAIDTAKVFPLDYLGIDLVIDAIKGPQIMEVNVRPGLGIQLVNKLGMAEAIRRHYNA